MQLARTPKLAAEGAQVGRLTHMEVEKSMRRARMARQIIKLVNEFVANRQSYMLPISISAVP